MVASEEELSSMELVYLTTDFCAAALKHLLERTRQKREPVSCGQNFTVLIP
jgi:hypothetical protein